MLKGKGRGRKGRREGGGREGGRARGMEGAREGGREETREGGRAERRESGAAGLSIETDAVTALWSLEKICTLSIRVDGAEVEGKGGGERGGGGC